MKKLFLLGILILFTASSVSAASLTFTWDPPTTAPTGYKLYYGKTSGTYTANVDMRNITTYTLANLDVSAGGTWYFAATAYVSDTSGTRESAYSNEVSVTFPIKPGNFKITITVSP
jgi:hypothetical protein